MKGTRVDTSSTCFNKTKKKDNNNKKSLSGGESFTVIQMNCGCLMLLSNRQCTCLWKSSNTILILQSWGGWNSSAWNKRVRPFDPELTYLFKGGMRRLSTWHSILASYVTVQSASSYQLRHCTKKKREQREVEATPTPSSMGRSGREIIWPNQWPNQWSQDYGKLLSKQPAKDSRPDVARWYWNATSTTAAKKKVPCHIHDSDSHRIFDENH